MQPMPLLLLALLSVMQLALLPSANAQADIDVDVPGARVQVNKGGTNVQAPGVNITVPGNVSMGSPSLSEMSLEQDIIVQGLNPVPHSRTGGKSYTNATLDGMNFDNQDLSGADFTNASLRSASFRGANLSHANLSNADLAQADLTGANLTKADLTNADLSGALVAGTLFDSADMTNANTQGMVRDQVMVPAPSAQLVTSTIIRDRLQAPVKQGEKAKIDLTVNFDFDSDRLTPDGARQVKEIATALNDPAMARTKIMIEGHTDAMGSDDYNQKLSDRRAYRVLTTLSEDYRIPTARLSAMGFGESRPIASNDSDLGRAKNRRVTLVNMGQI